MMRKAFRRGSSARRSGPLGKTLAAASLLVACFLLAAPEAFAIHPTTVLKKMEKEWNGVNTMRADVKQVFFDERGATREVYYGRIAVRRPRSLRFDFGPSATPEVAFASPESSYRFTVFTTDGEYLFEYDRKENTITRDTIEGLDALPFLKAVAGLEGFNVERFNREFYIDSDVLEEKIDSAPVYVLEAKPRPGYEQIHQPFKLWVGVDDSLPRKMRIELPQETIEVALSDFVIDEPIPMDRFRVDVPITAEVIDRATHF